jgi:hypothetical protein
MFADRLTTRVTLLFAATSLLLSGCSGSSGGSGPPSMQQNAANIHNANAASQQLSPHRRIHAAEVAAKPGSGGSQCIPIDSVYPNSDFHGLGFTAGAVSGGDHLNVDATGCNYGIYLYPGAPNLHVDHAIVKGAFRVTIFAEDVTGVTIDHTVVNGTSAGTADPNSFSDGGIAFRGASGTVTNTQVFNITGFGMNIVANNGCFEPALAPCMLSNVTADHVLIDNSATTGDGFDVEGAFYPTPFSTAVITHSTVIGGNLSTLPHESEIDNDGAQTGVASIDGDLTLKDDKVINAQVGFDVYCSNSNVNSFADLKNNDDKVVTGTTVALPQTPLPANQTLNVFDVQQMDGAFGAGYC